MSLLADFCVHEWKSRYLSPPTWASSFKGKGLLHLHINLPGYGVCGTFRRPGVRKIAVSHDP